MRTIRLASRVSLLALAAATSLPLITLSLPFMTSSPVVAETITLDTAKLARMAGTKVVFESPQTTILTVSATVPEAAEAQAQALKAAGWIAYVPPSTEIRKDDAFEMRTFKKGRQGLTLSVTRSPTKVTNIQLTDNPLTFDLPIAADATDVVFETTRPYASFKTGGTVESALKAFEDGLAADGWSRWAPAPGQTQPSNNVSAEGANVFFVKTGVERPLLVTVNSKPGPLMAVRAEGVAPSLLKPPKQEETAAKEPSPAEEAARKTHTEMDDAMDKAMSGIANSIMTEVESALANGGAGKPITKPAASGGAVQKLLPMTNTESPMPLPEGAEALEIGDGEIEFESAVPVPAVAQFFKAEMKKAGWSQRPSVISRETMEVQNYTKGDKAIDITIMQMGGKARVTARGDGLEREEIAATETPAAEPADQGPDVTLEAEDKGGLPVPTPHSSSGRESTLFRVSVTATVKARLDTVVAFYRAELSKRSWTEETSKAQISAKAATLSFIAPDGPAILSITQKGAETSSMLFIRKTKEAEKSGLMPKPDKVTVLIGNASETDASVKVAGATLKASAGIGVKGPDGPKVEVAPGKQTVTFSFKGGKPETETLDMKAGEIWGILVAPGGALPMQLY